MLWVQQNLLISSCRLRPSWRCFCRAGECRQQWNILPSKNMNHSKFKWEEQILLYGMFFIAKTDAVAEGYVPSVWWKLLYIFALLGSATANSLCASHTFCTFETAVNSTTLRLWQILVEYILRHRYSVWDLEWGHDRKPPLVLQRNEQAGRKSLDENRVWELGRMQGLHEVFVFVVAVLVLVVLTVRLSDECVLVLWSLTT